MTKDLFITQSVFSNNKVLESDFELDLDGVQELIDSESRN